MSRLFRIALREISSTTHDMATPSASEIISSISVNPNCLFIILFTQLLLYQLTRPYGSGRYGFTGYWERLTCAEGSDH